MTTIITPSAGLVPAASLFTDAEQLALAGFLAGYSGLTRQAYELDLRQFVGWCQQRQIQLFQARRADTVSGQSPQYKGGTADCHASGPVTVIKGVTSRVEVDCQEK
ncbi:MAG TPA: hypothetical protein VKS82_03775 [Streptosporangiaceae bacterium]|nr:hypothetical protein [Streptosporangiaceae bacterium]